MRFLSLFSGIEAASVAWNPLGWACVAVAEIEPFPCAVLAHHYPRVPNLGDVTKITREQVAALGQIDLVCGGFPCQDLSVAGKRKGMKNADGSATRSGLFFNAMRIAEWSKARWVVIENVPGLFSSNAGSDFAAVVGEMAGCKFDVPADGWRNTGVAAGPLGLVQWTTLDAQFVRVQSHPRAVPQRRRRVFIVRYSGDWRSAPPLFLVRESLCRNTPPRRETRQEVAPTVRAGSANGSAGHGARSGDSKDELIILVAPTMDQRSGRSGANSFVASGGLVPVAQALIPERARALTTKNQRIDAETETLLVTHAMTTIAFPANLSGTQCASSEDVSPSLCAINPTAIAFDPTQITSKANGSNPKPGDPCHTLAKGQHTPHIAYSPPPAVIKINACSEPFSLQNMGFNEHKFKYAKTSKTDAIALLRRVRSAIGEETLSRWGFGVLGQLQSSEVLQPGVHGGELRQEAQGRRRVICCAFSVSITDSEGAMQSVRKAECVGCTSQGRELPEQLHNELGAYLSELSHSGAPGARFVRDLWCASEGIGVLREALSAFQKVGQPAVDQGEPALETATRFGADTREVVFCTGLHDVASREGILREARCTIQARDIGTAAEDKTGSGIGAMGQPFAVRRLTPLETERLMGFEDGYTAIPHRGKLAADGPRYKSHGNSWAVNCASWVGTRIQMVEDLTAKGVA